MCSTGKEWAQTSGKRPGERTEAREAKRAAGKALRRAAASDREQPYRNGLRQRTSEYRSGGVRGRGRGARDWGGESRCGARRSEEHTSELQSRFDLVCRLLLEKKK